MPDDTQAAPHLRAFPTHDQRGEPCLGVQLAGTRAAGRVALIDAEGLARLRAAGARSLCISRDGGGREYVVFSRYPHTSTTSAARVITDAPVGFRVEFLGRSRLDLRRRSLRLRRHAKAGAGRRPRRPARPR